MQSATLNHDDDQPQPRRGHHTYCADDCYGLTGTHYGQVFTIPAIDGPVKLWLQGNGATPDLGISIADDQPAYIRLEDINVEDPQIVRDALAAMRERASSRLAVLN